MTETTKRDEREAFKWPPLPGFPSAMWTCNGVGLFTEHQMQGYANAYGEAIRAALATAPEQAGEHVAWAVVNANGYAKYVTNDAEEAARWRETYQDVRPLAYASPLPASTNRLTDWRAVCAALIDIYDDAMNNVSEDRCYVDGAWEEEIDRARALLTANDKEVSMLTDEQKREREQLNLIAVCKPDFLILHIKENTNYDAELLARVFELAKERARAIIAATEEK